MTSVKWFLCCSQSEFSIKKSWKSYLKSGDSTTKPKLSREVMSIIKEYYPVFSEDLIAIFKYTSEYFEMKRGMETGRRRRRERILYEWSLLYHSSYIVLCCSSNSFHSTSFSVLFASQAVLKSLERRAEKRLETLKQPNESKRHGF